MFTSSEPSRPSKRIGVEWSNHYTPLRWLLLDLDLAWTRARFSDDDPAGNRIPDSLQAGVTVHNLGPWKASLWRRYFGPRTLIEDGGVQWASDVPINPRTRVRPDVFNIFDSKVNDITYYYASRLPGESPASINDFHFHPMESRSFRLGPPPATSRDILSRATLCHVCAYPLTLRIGLRCKVSERLIPTIA